MADAPDNELLQMIMEGNAAFDELVQQRHDAGAEKYGSFKFLGANTLEEAMEEILDLANYARYTYIKLWMLNAQVSEKYGEPEDPEARQQFISARPDVMPTRPRLAGEHE